MLPETSSTNITSTAAFRCIITLFIVNECASQGAQPAGQDIQALITSHDGVIDKAKVPLTIGTPWILNVLLLIFVPVKPNWDKFVYPAGNPMVHVSAVLAPVSVNVSSYSAPHVSVILIR